MKMIAIVDIELVDNTQKVRTVQPYSSINADTFVEDWTDGVAARQKWEQFCNAFYHLLIESGFIDENGLHVDDYTAGSVFRFIKANPDMLTESFRDSAVGMMVMQAVKSGAKMIKKGKDIDINWPSINQHTGPMTEAVLNRMLIDTKRRELLQPIFAKFLTLPADSTPAADPAAE